MRRHLLAFYKVAKERDTAPLIEEIGYETGQMFLLYVGFCSLFGLNLAQDTIVVCSVLRHKAIEINAIHA